MTTRRIVVVTAGLRSPSSTRMLSDRLAESAVNLLAQQGIRAEAHTVELRAVAHALTDRMLTGFASPELQAELDAVTTADAVIAVTPVFSASYSGLFKSFFDVLDTATLEGKPVLLGATGGSARHSLALDYAVRPLFAYLRADVVPTAVFGASEDWGSAESHLGSRIDRAAGELAAVVAARTPVAAVPRQAEVTPFEQLLSGR